MISLQQFVAKLIDVAKRVTHHDAKAWDDAALRREIGHVSAELDALWAMVKLSVCESSQTGVPGLGGSAIKLFYTELYQRVCDLGMRLLGRANVSREDVAQLPSQNIETCSRSLCRSPQGRRRSSATSSPSASWACPGIRDPASTGSLHDGLPALRRSEGAPRGTPLVLR
jgi:hypothetical protein